MMHGEGGSEEGGYEEGAYEEEYIYVSLLFIYDTYLPYIESNLRCAFPFLPHQIRSWSAELCRMKVASIIRHKGPLNCVKNLEVEWG